MNDLIRNVNIANLKPGNLCFIYYGIGLVLNMSLKRVYFLHACLLDPKKPFLQVISVTYSNAYGCNRTPTTILV